MTLPYVFASATTIVSSQFDTNFDAVAALGFLPCTIAGTGNYTFTPVTGTSPNVSTYSSPLYISGVASGTNAGAVTAQVNSIGFLPVYKDTVSGPIPLTGGEIVSGNQLLLMYDAALNSGAGGFHLVSANVNAVTGYLPLAGGTLTGPLAAPTITSVAKLSFGAASTSSITRAISAAVSTVFPTIAAGATSDYSFSVAGVKAGDAPLFSTNGTTITTGVLVNTSVNSNNTVTLRAGNITGASVTNVTISGNLLILGNS